MKNVLPLLASFVAVAALVGCSSEPGPVQGDNPAAAGGVTATKEQQAARGGFKQTTNPPGTGRGGSGSTLPVGN